MGLHFSDTWADPQHQDIPVAWRGLHIDGLEKAWEKHAFDTIKALKDAGAMPDQVQIGNEIARGAAWPVAQLQIPGNNQYLPPQPYDEAKQWSNLTRLLKAGIRGVESAAGKTKPRIFIHIDQGGHWDTIPRGAIHKRIDLALSSTNHYQRTPTAADHPAWVPKSISAVNHGSPHRRGRQWSRG